LSTVSFQGALQAPTTVNHRRHGRQPRTTDATPRRTPRAGSGRSSAGFGPLPAGSWRVAGRS
jgi:hypothetical protein